MPDTQVAEAETATTEASQTDATPDLAAEVEKWKTHSRTWETRAKENAEKAKEFDAYKASQMTELEKAQKEAADAKSLLDAALAAQKGAELAALRARIGAEKGLPVALIARLQGEDEKSIAADADALIAAIPATSDGPARIDIGQGTRGTSPAAPNALEAVLRTKLGIT